VYQKESKVVLGMHSVSFGEHALFLYIKKNTFKVVSLIFALFAWQVRQRVPFAKQLLSLL